MKKSSAIQKSELNETELDEYYKDAAMDAILYWLNCTHAMTGSNTTLSILTEAMASSIVNLVPPDQVDRAEDVIMGLLEESFQTVRDKRTTPDKPSDLN